MEPKPSDFASSDKLINLKKSVGNLLSDNVPEYHKDFGELEDIENFKSLDI